MDTITLHVTIDKARRIEIDVPPDVPLGEAEVQVVIRPLNNGSPERELTREEIKARLRAAGLLAEFEAPKDAVALSDEEEEELAILLSHGAAKTTEALINEDREERF